MTTTFAGHFSYIPFFFTFIIVAVFLLRKTNWLRSRLQRFFRKYFGEPIASPRRILHANGVAMKTAALWAGLCTVTWLFEGVAYYLCLMAAGVEAPPLIAFYGYTFVRMFQFLPFFPGGAGEIETASSLLLTAYGFQVEPVIVGSILFRFIAYWPPIIIGVVSYFILFRKK